ncbi:phage tail protein [Providencia sp. PROV255]|uniref:phage tail protein n=1 Tax=Providencia sp. PROV255 TaxID=2949943 RepID=UPI00234B60D6|nr:phage tail protein [Providencia sp. PROV255]
MKYFALLTKLGENLLAQATALGTKLELTHMAVGDGGGSLPTPDTNQTKLIAEKRRAAINTLFIDEQNKNQIIAEQIIPEQDGGWWIREIGLFDKAGNLIAVANCPETYKPQLAEGSGRTQSIRMVLIVSHTESVTLKIDPSVVLATREYVNTEITVLDKKIDALSAQTKLDLNKKFDKANISGQKGNDNDKVPSLNLFTTEIGKLAVLGYSYSKTESDGRYQPKGNYAPAGDYATNAALTNGLDKKFDKTGGNIAGSVIATGVLSGLILRAINSSSIELKPGTNDTAVVTNIGNGYRAHLFQDKAGTLAHTSDIETAINTAVNVLNKIVPVGSSIFWNTSAPVPENFWPHEGRSFSATEYPEAAKIFPSLKLPDDRGYAIRVADNGRGIDAGRQVGSYQEDAMQEIKGAVNDYYAGEGIASSGAFSVNPEKSSRMILGGNGAYNLYTSSGGLVFDSGKVTRTANETRMKNVAKILITRMK